MRKFSLVLFATLHSFICIDFTFGQDKLISVKTIEWIKSTTVPIVCGTPTQDGRFRINKIIGSAFFINEEGYFLTAGHVFDDWKKIDQTKGTCFPFVYMIIGGWQADSTQIRWFGFNTCIKNKSADIAVCKPQVNPFTTDDVKRQINFATFKKLQTIKDGTPTAFTGFPLNFLRPITTKGNIASYIETEKKIVIDTNAWPGASGSPVYLSDGKVIGVIIQMGINEGSGLAFARDSESVIKFLTENKIRFYQEN